jgi:hypothetical protein
MYYVNQCKYGGYKWLRKGVFPRKVNCIFLRNK